MMPNTKVSKIFFALWIVIVNCLHFSFACETQVPFSGDYHQKTLQECNAAIMQ